MNKFLKISLIAGKIIFCIAFSFIFLFFAYLGFGSALINFDASIFQKLAIIAYSLLSAFSAVAIWLVLFKKMSTSKIRLFVSLIGLSGILPIYFTLLSVAISGD